MLRLTVILLIALGLAACTPQSWTDQHGKRIDQQSLTSRWLVVNYWAEWCGPCREEIPELNALSLERPDIAVVGVHFDGLQAEPLREVSDMMNVRFPVLDADFAAALDLPRPEVLPTTYVVAPAGEGTVTLKGPQTVESILAIVENRSGP